MRRNRNCVKRFVLNVEYFYCNCRNSFRFFAVSPPGLTASRRTSGRRGFGPSPPSPSDRRRGGGLGPVRPVRRRGDGRARGPPLGAGAARGRGEPGIGARAAPGDRRRLEGERAEAQAADARLAALVPERRRLERAEVERVRGARPADDAAAVAAVVPAPPQRPRRGAGHAGGRVVVVQPRGRPGHGEDQPLGGRLGVAAATPSSRASARAAPAPLGLCPRASHRASSASDSCCDSTMPSAHRPLPSTALRLAPASTSARAALKSRTMTAQCSRAAPPHRARAPTRLGRGRCRCLGRGPRRRRDVRNSRGATADLDGRRPDRPRVDVGAGTTRASG